MFCPQCGTEYREGVTVCRDCGVGLVEDRPPEPAEPRYEWADLVTVLRTSDPALIAVAKSLLEAEGIPCFAQGERLQDLLGLGRAGGGVNLVTGPVQLQVPREHESEARLLLEARQTQWLEAPTDDDAEES